MWYLISIYNHPTAELLTSNCNVLLSNQSLLTLPPSYYLLPSTNHYSLKICDINVFSTWFWFYAWFVLFNIMFSNFIHIVTNKRISSFSQRTSIQLCIFIYIFFIHLSVDRHLNCFLFNCTEINIEMQMFC